MSKRILVVDPNEINRMLVVGAIVKKFGNSCPILEAVDGLSALTLLKEDNEIAIIFMELKLREISGLELIKSLRCFEKADMSKKIIVVLTGQGKASEEILSLVDEYVLIPVSSDIILGILEKYEKNLQ